MRTNNMKRLERIWELQALVAKSKVSIELKVSRTIKLYRLAEAA